MGEFKTIQRRLAFALNDAQDLNEAMGLSLDAALEVSGLDAGAFYLIDEQREEGRLAYARGLSDSFVEKVSSYKSDDPRYLMVMRAVPLYILFRDLPGDTEREVQMEGLKALALIPITHRGEVLGCLTLGSRSLDEIPKEVRPNLESIAQQCGGVISRMKAEDALKRSEERNRALLEAIPDLMFLLDGNLIFRDYHAADPKTLLVPPEEFLGRSITEVLPQKLAERFRERLAKVGRRAGPEELVYSLTLSGEKRHFEARIVRCWESYYLVMIRDITETKRLEDALRHSENKYRTLVTEAGDAIIIADLDGKVLEANRMAGIILGHPVEKLTRMNFLKLHADQAADIASSYFDMAVKGRSFPPYDTLMIRNDGTPVPTSVSLRSIEYSDRRVIQCSMRDITERKRVEAIKDNIIRDLAHKLKTPLAMAQMGLDELSEAVRSGDEELEGRSMRMVENSVVMLRSDVDRILDYFQFTIRSGVAPAGPSSFRKVLEDVLREERVMVGDRPVEFLTKIDEDVGEVMMNAQDLHTLLGNLVGNAVKFTKEGKITVEATSGDKAVRVTISDTGVGFTPEIRERIFERFFQGSPAHSGVGLGLAMCKEAVERCGGEISVDSPGPGKGTQATVEIPKP